MYAKTYCETVLSKIKTKWQKNYLNIEKKIAFLSNLPNLCSTKNYFIYFKIKTMNTQLEKQFLQLEEDRKNLFNELKNYSDEVINKKPAPEKWSVAEVIAHLITAEEMSLKYLSKKIQDTSKESDEGLKNKYRWLLVQIVFTFNIKFKAPEIVEPKMGYQSLGALETKWSDVRNQTLQTLQKLSEEEVNKTLWKHALAGKMNLHHMVQFFGVHYNRHKKQIERTIVAVK